MVLKCGSKIQSSHISAFYWYNNSLWDRNLEAHIADTLYHGSCDAFNKERTARKRLQRCRRLPTVALRSFLNGTENTTRCEYLIGACAFTWGWRRSEGGTLIHGRRLPVEQRLWSGLTFAQVDCGDEVKELCVLVHLLGLAPRREHVMS